jgi:hypothetical protein
LNRIQDYNKLCKGKVWKEAVVADFNIMN